MAEALIVYGPQACGKTRNAAAIARAHGLEKIIDDWRPGMDTPDDTLILTNHRFITEGHISGDYGRAYIMSYRIAMMAVADVVPNA